MLRAYGYTGMVTTGPMLLGICFLLGIGMIGGFFGLPKGDRELLNSMITYGLLFSLLLSSGSSMVITRYISDMLFSGEGRRILPSLKGLMLLMLPLGDLLYGIFLFFAGITLTQALWSLLFFNELLVVWTEMNYMTAIKDYKGILVSYVAAIAAAFLSSALGSYIFGASIEVLLFGVSVGYGLMLCMNYLFLNSFFPRGESGYFQFLDWFEDYRELGFVGFCTTVGLFSHLVAAWFGPFGKQVQGLYYGAPQYDIPALFAFLTITVTTVNFVASVEVNFYPKYRRYYELFNGKGSLRELELAEENMLGVMSRELSYTAKRQLFVTALTLSLGLSLLLRLPLGFDSMMEGYFRILCVGYGLYAVGNVMLLLLLYFTDYTGAAWASGIFAISSTLLCILSFLLDSRFYGFPFALSAMLYFLICWQRLGDFTSSLPYHILSRQPLFHRPRYGVIRRLRELLEEFYVQKNS